MGVGCPLFAKMIHAYNTQRLKKTNITATVICKNKRYLSVNPTGRQEDRNRHMNSTTVQPDQI